MWQAHLHPFTLDLSKSTSAHVAPRNSPGRTKVSASDCRPKRTCGAPLWPSIAQQCAQPGRVDDCRTVADDWRLHAFFKTVGRIVVG
jgi:hypothetical protein